MTNTATASRITTATRPASRDNSPRTLDLEALTSPDEGYLTMPCFDTVLDVQDAVTSHLRECNECQREMS